MAVINGKWHITLTEHHCPQCRVPYDLANETILENKGTIAYHWEWKCKFCERGDKTVHTTGTGWLRRLLGW